MTRRRTDAHYRRERYDDLEEDMARSRRKERRPAAASLGALALGAAAVGALALGYVAIGRLAVGRARVKRLEIDELVVRKVRQGDDAEVSPGPDA